MPEFDAYLMVDWSANNTPKRGKDSIWYCMLVRTSDGLCSCPPQNPSTREEAFSRIKDLLIENIERSLSTLVGFDFPYGYPSGFTSALVQKKTKRYPKWRQVWNAMSKLIEDSEVNRNNRFEIAAKLNKRISGTNYPFWGCPERMNLTGLSAHKPRGSFDVPFCEKRFTEQRVRKAQPVWKLAYPGSVGSQALVGIPYLARLRYDRALARYSLVWPFETGLREPFSRIGRRRVVLHAEIFPSIIKATPRKGEVKDAAQVRELAAYFAAADEKGDLVRLFEGPADLTEKQRRVVKQEEGWILGVLKDD